MTLKFLSSQVGPAAKKTTFRYVVDFGHVFFHGLQLVVYSNKFYQLNIIHVFSHRLQWYNIHPPESLRNI